MPDTYLAIDIGASSGRHIAAWLENGMIKTQEVYRFPNEAVMKDGHLCWEQKALFHHVVAGLKAAKFQHFHVCSVGIDTWGVDFMLLDGHDQPVGDMIAYRDKRTEGIDALLEDALPFQRHFALSGIARQPFNTVYQLIAALKEHPEYRDRVQDFLLTPEYLSFLLTGNKCHEWTILSTGALCDAHTRDWAWDILQAAGLPEHWFHTPILPPGSDIGHVKMEIAREIGYSPRVILPAAHDTGSAYMAVPARDTDAAFLSSGTWSLLGTELSTPVTSQEALLCGFTNEGGYGQTTRFLKNIMGMWILQCIRKETNQQYTYAEMAEMARVSHYPAWIDAKNQRFMAPKSMLREVEAALLDQDAPSPKGLADILRAVTMGLAVCYRDSIQEMQRITGKTFTSINIVGGGSQNVVLNQMTADITGLPVYAGPTEGTALGNLGAQMIHAGEFKDLQHFRNALARSFSVTEYLPNQKSNTEERIHPS